MAKLRGGYDIDPRTDARGGHATPPLGPVATDRCVRHSRGAQHSLPLRRHVLEVDVRPSHGVEALYAPRRTLLDRHSWMPLGALGPRCGPAHARPSYARDRTRSSPTFPSIGMAASGPRSRTSDPSATLKSP
jgi:hypothetical protein